MPSIELFLELFEAVSRRDWNTIREVGEAVAEEERRKKHYSAAHRIIQAVEVALSNSAYDLIAYESLTHPLLRVDENGNDVVSSEEFSWEDKV